MTRNGVEYQLEKSPFIYEVNNLMFYFTSINHLNKFISNLENFICNMRYKFSERYGYYAYLDLLFLLILYSKIETRGFYIKYEGREFTCKSQVTLGGEIKIL